jgi:hypothetical protein
LGSWFWLLQNGWFFLLRQQIIKINWLSDFHNYCHLQIEDDREKIPPKHKMLGMVYGLNLDLGADGI